MSTTTSATEAPSPRDILGDIVRQTSTLFDAVRVTGSSTETVLQAVDKEKTLFLKATLKEPEAELEGDFGIANLDLLSGLLAFPNYKTAEASFAVKRKKMNGAETVEQFEFRDAGGAGADFRTMSGELVEQAKIANIPWDISVVPSKSKIAEFSQLSSLYSKVDQGFGVRCKDGDLVLFIGDEGDSSHRANMVFETDVKQTVNADAMRFNIAQFLAVLKLAGSNNATMSVCARGVIGLTIETAVATYNYYLRAKR